MPFSRVAPADGADIPAAFPKGHAAFYCAKDELLRTEYADFLNALPSTEAPKYHIRAKGSGSRHFPVLKKGVLAIVAGKKYFEPFTNRSSDRYVANPEQRTCNWMSWWDGAIYAAWAGLRPMTELEFEKACRGPYMPVPDEFAWGTDTQRGVYATPEMGDLLAALQRYAAGFHKRLRTTPGAGASYWGIMNLSQGNYERVVTIGDKQGRLFRGTHGLGTASLPGDWPGASTTYAPTHHLLVPKVSGAGSRGGDTQHAVNCSRVSERSLAGDVRKRGGHGYATWRSVRTAPRREKGR